MFQIFGELNYTSSAEPLICAHQSVSILLFLFSLDAIIVVLIVVLLDNVLLVVRAKKDDKEQQINKWKAAQVDHYKGSPDIILFKIRFSKTSNFRGYSSLKAVSEPNTSQA